MNKNVKSPSAVLALCIVFSSFSVLADPGNGHGNGNGKGNAHGNSKHAEKGQGNASKGGHKKGGNPCDAERDIGYSFARGLAEEYGITGYKSLPPGIAKNLARGKPLPPGIAKRSLPPSMLNELPYYPGHEWKIVGDNLVLIALSTAVVTAVINGVFD